MDIPDCLVSCFDMEYMARGFCTQKMLVITVVKAEQNRCNSFAQILAQVFQAWSCDRT